jgi:hypothetical protein
MPTGYLAPTGTSFSCEKWGAVTTYDGGDDGSCRYVNTNYILAFDQVVGKTSNWTTTGTSNSCMVL